ncbi:MAG: hypothetical protein CFH28_00810, partial [Alphaproteobacteria bacterium MarineAlpha6_Bin6]
INLKNKSRLKFNFISGKVREEII